MLDKIISELRNYPGITRKHIISDVTAYFQDLIEFAEVEGGHKVLAALGEDAAVIEFGDNDDVLLLAADGIMKSLMDADLKWAGYCVVLVNINDIAAMGGIPLAMVNVLSLQNMGVYEKIMGGVKDAIEKFKIPMVGGHSHPDCDYNAVDVAILGTAKRPDLIYSHTANVDDDIIFAMDIDGRLHPNSKYSWDTTTRKSSSEVREQVLIMNKLGKNKLVTAGKDISNPGTLGTLGMLLESSNKGAWVDLNSIPYPDKDIDFIHWLKVYQGCGFVVTCKPNNSDEIVSIFNSVGIAASVAGKIQASPKLEISDGEDSEILFDFDKDIITGIRS
ncbi:MAG: methanogenesis marker 2 protein [Thermoplasmata archaeon]|nr:methanogenesis marker 2 protein [Thermoplasmata archaeon]